MALDVGRALRVEVGLGGALALERALEVGVSFTRWQALARGEWLRVRLEVELRKVEAMCVWERVEVKEVKEVQVASPGDWLVRALALCV